MRQDEHNLQAACVRWFALQYPSLKGLLFAVPNGGNRNPVTAAKLKAEGVVPGVADLILLVSRFVKSKDDEGWYNTIHALCIELKTKQGRQSQAQTQWQEKVEGFGYKYIIVRSLDDFINQINDYLCN